MHKHLAVNNLDTLQDGQPGTHAFIVGVSNYEFLPGSGDPVNPATFLLRKLSSPATSAYLFHKWLTDSKTKLVRPLATSHLLLAPSDVELAAHPGMAEYAGATVSDFIREIRQWRRLCSTNRDAQAIFYFCGHGVQALDSDAVLLLQDFGNPNAALENGCLRFSNIFDGMAPHTIQGQDSCRDIAREQIYFVDACRDNPDQLKGLRTFQGVSAFSPPLADEDNRNAPVFFGTIPGDKSYGQAGRVSIFTGALLEGLQQACDGELPDDAGAPTWPVRVQFLHKVVKRLLMRGGAQSQRIGNLQGLVGDPTLHYLPQAPEIDAEVDIAPADVVRDATIEIEAIAQQKCVWTTTAEPPPQYPYRFNMRLGFYKIRASHKDFSTFEATKLLLADENGSKLTVRMKRLPVAGG